MMKRGVSSAPLMCLETASSVPVRRPGILPSLVAASAGVTPMPGPVGHPQEPVLVFRLLFLLWACPLARSSDCVTKEVRR